MKEILTIQLGSQGNFTGAYFWQIQDAYQHGFEFHDPFFIQNPDRYYPRMIGLDWKASLSFPIPRQSQAEILWEGNIKKFESEASSEAKWTDLIIGMLDLKNLMPCYRDDPMRDDLEEKIRWLAEKSESAQGSHILADCEFSNYLLETIEICEDFFPKLPTFLMSFNYKMSIEEEFMMYNLSNYSQILNVICNQAVDKTGWAAAATVLDSACYWYRNQEQRIGNIIQGLMPRSQGNLVSAEMFGDFEYRLGPSGDDIYSLGFSRGDESCEAAPLPSDFPISFERENIKISANTGIYDFLEEFKQRPDHNHNRDELLETRNYLASLKDNYML